MTDRELIGRLRLMYSYNDVAVHELISRFEKLIAVPTHEVEVRIKTESISAYEPIQCVPYQGCPVCNGVGKIFEQNVIGFIPCHACKGFGCIPMHVVKKD